VPENVPAATSILCAAARSAPESMIANRSADIVALDTNRRLDEGWLWANRKPESPN
jgi:hypothetical protein